MPMLTPTIFFNMVQQIITSFRVFTESYVITNGGPMDSTLTYVLYLYRSAFTNFHMGYSCALAWILVVIIGIATAILFKSQDAWVHYEGSGGNTTMVGQKSSKAQSVFFHVFSCALGFIMIYPLLWLLMSSFKSNDTMVHNAFSLIPEKWDIIQNYASGFKGIAGISFWTFFKNSAIVTVASVAGSMPTTSPSAVTGATTCSCS